MTRRPLDVATTGRQPGPGRPPPRLLLRVAGLLIGLTALVSIAGPAAATTTQEVAVHSLIDRARVNRGLPPLVLNGELSQLAHRHSLRMAQQRRLFHTPCLECRIPIATWTMLGENVGSGGSIRRIHRTLMRSTPHRQNVLGGFDAVGVGVVERGGRFWVTQIFFAGLVDGGP